MASATIGTIRQANTISASKKSNTRFSTQLARLWKDQEKTPCSHQQLLSDQTQTPRDHVLIANLWHLKTRATTLLCVAS